jgi:hypothetical protein
VKDREDARNRKAANRTNRAEQVRHLVRSVGVEMDNGDCLPYFIELAPGRFWQNPALKSMVVEDGRLCTLRVASNTPAKIPNDGLPVEVLKYLIAIGLKGDGTL